MARALEYMGLTAGTPMEEVKVDKVFIGSCTNARIEDLRQAARILYGRKVAPKLYCMLVPGSGLVKKQAEAEGLDKIFIQAGFDWREAGCSMCLGSLLLGKQLSTHETPGCQQWASFCRAESYDRLRKDDVQSSPCLVCDVGTKFAV